MVAESLRVPFLKLGLQLATELGQNKKLFGASTVGIAIQRGEG